MSEIQRSVQSTLGKYQPLPRQEIGLLGNGAGVVSVPDQPRMVYVRVRGSVVTAYNIHIAAVNDMPVVVGYDYYNPRVFQVLDAYIDPSSIDGQTYNPTIQLHHETHEFLNPLGGQDTVWMGIRQLTTARVTPVGGMKVFVHSGIFLGDSSYLNIGSIADLDLTSYQPVSGALYVLIQIARDGSINVKVGTAVSTLASLTMDYIPVPDAGYWPLAAVALYAGQTEIQESNSANDIIDLRLSSYSTLYGSGTADTLAYWSSGSALSSVPDQSANLFYASPNGSTGAPAFRAVAAADLGTGADNTKYLRGDMTWQVAGGTDRKSVV